MASQRANHMLLAASFWEGRWLLANTHEVSFLPKWAHPTDLIWYKTKKTWKCKYNKHNSWSLWCAHQQQYSCVVLCLNMTRHFLWVLYGLWKMKPSWGEKGNFENIPLFQLNSVTYFAKIEIRRGTVKTVLEAALKYKPPSNSSRTWTFPIGNRSRPQLEAAPTCLKLF